MLDHIHTLSINDAVVEASAECEYEEVRPRLTLLTGLASILQTRILGLHSF